MSSSEDDDLDDGAFEQDDDVQPDGDAEPPARGGRRRPGRWLVGLLVLALVGAALVAVLLPQDKDDDQFCFKASQIDDVGLPQPGQAASPEEAANRVRVVGARLLLLHEELGESAGRSLRGPIAELVEGYRSAVRSGELSDLVETRESESSNQVMAAIEATCNSEE